jgi:hypothetical protein
MTLREKRETLFTLVFSAIAYEALAKSSLLQFQVDPWNTAGFGSLCLGGEEIRHKA